MIDRSPVLDGAIYWTLRELRSTRAGWAAPASPGAVRAEHPPPQGPHHLRGRAQARLLCCASASATPLYLPVAAPARRQPVADLEALGEPELLQLSHVGLERQRSRPKRARSGARVAGRSAISASTVAVHGPCRLAASRRASRASISARLSRRGLAARAVRSAGRSRRAGTRRGAARPSGRSRESSVCGPGRPRGARPRRSTSSSAIGSTESDASTPPSSGASRRPSRSGAASAGTRA